MMLANCNWVSACEASIRIADGFGSRECKVTYPASAAAGRTLPHPPQIRSASCFGKLMPSAAHACMLREYW